MNEDTTAILQAVAELRIYVEVRLGDMDARFDRLESRMDRLEIRMDRLEGAILAVAGRLLADREVEIIRAHIGKP
jgi:hypothetical protein